MYDIGATLALALLLYIIRLEASMRLGFLGTGGAGCLPAFQVMVCSCMDTVLGSLPGRVDLVEGHPLMTREVVTRAGPGHLSGWQRSVMAEQQL
jgi:hypothetical protein